jgi:hypothetical protein
MIMPKIKTLDAGNNFLHAYGSEHEFRVVALAIPAPFTAAQDWTIVDRGNGRFALRLEMGGIDRYLTAEGNGGTHVFTRPKDSNFTRQTWRGDQSSTTNRISLGKSGRFLQADVDGQILIQPDGDGTPRGFNVELVKEENFGNGSTWTPPLT